MILIPAIDLLNGDVVRLEQGRYDKKTIFPGTPTDYITRWQDAGAERIHVVDLEGARSGKVNEWRHLEAMAKAARVPLELGGGLRSLEDIKRAFDIGLRYVVLGTAAIKDRKLLGDALRAYSTRIIVGVDCKDGRLRSEGWTEETQVELVPFCGALEKVGVKEIIYTNIARDGMLKGPDVDGLTHLLENTGMNIVLSGGVSNMQDIEQLSKVRDPRFVGVICGRALYDGRIDLVRAVTLLKNTVPKK